MPAEELKRQAAARPMAGPRHAAEGRGLSEQQAGSRANQPTCLLCKSF